MRPFQTWDCGDASCPVKSSEGKRLERVIVWSLDTLETINQLVNSTQLQNARYISAANKNVATQLIDALEAARKNPFDQPLHEQLWVVGEQAVNLLPSEHKLLLLPWIPPFASAIPEMAFCRVVDAWKDYVEKRTGAQYGQHRSKLSAEHQCCDDCLNALRNLFVHSTGFLEDDNKGGKRYDKFVRLSEEAVAYSSSANSILKIPSRVCALKDGDVVMLNILEVCEYVEGVKELFSSLE